MPFAAALITGALFISTVRHPLVLDSRTLVGRNEFLRDAETSALDLWRVSPWHGFNQPTRGAYRPVTMTSFWLTMRLGADVPAVHHAVNVALHMATVFLLAVLLGAVRLPRPVIIAAALWYAVHPVHVEPVCLVAGRSELLMTLLVVVALLCHVRASQAATARRAALLLAAGLLAGFLAITSKENGAAVVPLVLIVEGWLLLGGGVTRWRGRTRWFIWALWLLPLVADLILRRAVLGIWFTSGAGQIVSELEQLTHVERLRYAMAVLAEAWRVSLPVALLSADYYFNQIPLPLDFGEPRILTAIAVGLALVIVPFSFPRRAGDTTAPTALLGLAWFAVAWAPTSHILFAVGDNFAERWLYLPSAGLIIWAAILVHRALGRDRVWAAVVTALTVVMVISTLWHVRPWHSQRTVHLATARASPHSWRALYNAGTAELFERNLSEAIRWYDLYLAEANPGDVRWAGARNNRRTALHMLATFEATGEMPPLPRAVPVTDFRRRR